MKAYLILEDGTVFEGTSIGSSREVISEIVFNTSMTGYLEVLTDPSYAGQAVVMTYPLIGNYGICREDMESRQAWPDGYIVRELSRIPSNFRSGDTIDHFLKEQDIPGISGIDTRALTKILREKGTMNGMITTNGDYDLEEVKEKIRQYTVKGVVLKTSVKKPYVLPGDGKKVALLDCGAKDNIARNLNKRAGGGGALQQLLQKPRAGEDHPCIAQQGKPLKRHVSGDVRFAVRHGADQPFVDHHGQTPFGGLVKTNLC